MPLDLSREYHPVPKGLPRVLTKQARKQTKDALAKDFRRAVWIRDRGRSRASGKPLAKSGSDYDRIGEVHHEYKRSTHPERIYDVSNGVLLSKTEHALAETRCPSAPQFFMLSRKGPDDLGEPQRWIWRNAHGGVVRERIG